MKKLFMLSLYLTLIFVLSSCRVIQEEPSFCEGYAAEFDGKCVVNSPITVQYWTGIELFDHGPMLSKVVLEFDIEILSTSVNSEMFDVDIVKIVKGFDYEKTAERIITDAYVSDKQGNPSMIERYVTIELESGPNTTEARSWEFDSQTNHVYLIEYYYVVSLKDEGLLQFGNGEYGVFLPTSDLEKAGELSNASDLFEHNNNFTYEDMSLRYAYYEPVLNNQKNEKVPLVIWLHGSLSGGTNTGKIIGTKFVNYAYEENQKLFGEFGAHLLFPQTPTYWDHYDVTAGESIYTEVLMELIKEYVSSNTDIDTNRIYVGGLSSGGYMTVNMLMNYPDYFAAGIPVCPYYPRSWITEENIEKLSKTPTWFVHAKSDKNVVIYSDGNMLDNHSNALYNRILDYDSNIAHYTVLDKVLDNTGEYIDSEGNPFEYDGHAAWIPVLNNEITLIVDGEEMTIMSWLSKQMLEK